LIVFIRRWKNRSKPLTKLTGCDHVRDFVSITRPIEEASYWLATRPPQPGETLTGRIEADVAIIGAGFTGLWTAHFLRQLEPKLSVVVLEQGVAGYGGSGRNAGIISVCLDHSHELAVAHFGQEEADRLAQLGLQNIEELAAFAGNECDFERTGQLHVALTPSQVAACRAMTHARFLNAEETRAELNSPLYLGAAFVSGGGIINPVKLVDKLRREIRLFDRSPVHYLAGNIVRTPAGEVRARKIVLATNAYSHQFLPKLLRHFIPLFDYVLVSEPLTAEQHAAIGWRNRQGVTDGRTFFNYYRLTADNRVLWGTSEARYYPRNRVDEACDHSEWHYRSLRESFDRHFPHLAGLKWEYAWGGPIAATTRLTPFFGVSGNIFYALGYTGHGIGSTRVAGKILAHMVLAKPSELLNLSMVRRVPFPYPPEPIRSWAVGAVTAALRRVDAGEKPGLLLRVLEGLGIGFSS
jgi:glycine/D-amino acid oxidase-like deaminating enzyme